MNFEINPEMDHQRTSNINETSSQPLKLFGPNFTKVMKWSLGEAETGNALIQGDNLNVLRMLCDTHAEKIKCVYLDPPYNNGETYLHYRDCMGHEEWLDSVKKRLQCIHTLLNEYGSVWISIDDSELHYLKVEADKIFGRKNFIGTIIWERRNTRENRKVFSRNHEYLLVYAKDLFKWSKCRNSLPINDEVRKRYKNLDNDMRGAWQSVSANVQEGHATKQQYYSLKSPSGKLHQAPKGRCWIYSEAKMQSEIAKNNIWFGKDGNCAPRLKKFLNERSAGLTPETLWRAIDVGTTALAKKHLLSIFSEISIFDTPKPEQLISRILEISTNPGDLILDPYLGSGTTVAVAQKMHRKYFGIEIGDHIKTHCVRRMKQVMEGEKGGISKDIGWTGGGGFDFYKI